MQTDSNSILLALSTYPNSNENDYIKLVIENIKNTRKRRYDLYSDKNDIDPELINLYKSPYVFHIWGKYDLAFLTLQDNLAISSKTFYPTNKNEEGENNIDFIKSQVISGICINNSEKHLLKDKYSRIKNKHFIGIASFKINNAFVLGAGYTFINSVYKLIDDQIKMEGSSIDYIIINSFGTFEITVLLFGENVSVMSNLIQRFRQQKLKHLRKAVPKTDINK